MTRPFDDATRRNIAARCAGFARLPAAFADRNADMLAWQRTPRPPVFDVSEIAATLEH